MDVFMLRRASTMAFTPDAVVFPAAAWTCGMWNAPCPGPGLSGAVGLFMSCLVQGQRRHYGGGPGGLEESGVLLASA
ncbi:MAG: hypothetical protein ACLUE1_00325 [Adlercreutzia equolifaciens]